MRNGKPILKIGLLIGILIAVNFLSTQFHYRIDLTTDKRYTLSDASKALLDDLDDVIYINIYLDGELPSEYRRLRNEIGDMLEEFRYASDGKIEYEFEDVLTGKDVKDKEAFLKQAASKGLLITRPDVKPDEAPSEKYIVPAGLAYYQEREFPVNFLQREFGKALEEEINNSIELLEYELSNIVRKAIAGKTKKLAFLRGHGELSDIEVADIAKSLEEYYKVETFNINFSDTNAIKPYIKHLRANPDRMDEVLVTEMISELNEYAGVIVAKPTYPFKEIEKFVLDQYIMNGGKVIFLMESLIAEMDSVAKYGNIFTGDYETNLEDMLFKAGVRINPNLIQDIQSHGIPVIQRGGNNKPTFWPWVFYPLLNASDGHPISKNLESVWGRFVSTIDTTANKDIRKTVLLTSSENSRVAYNPVNISMNMLEVRPNPDRFNQPYQTAAVLLEGRFESSFEYREGFKSKVNIPFVAANDSGAMVVISDGDLIRNQVTQRGEIYPLGYDRFASRTFGEPISFANKLFFMNCVDYLCDNSNIIEIRSKEVVLRLLDQGRVREEKSFWQWLNMTLPIGILALFGLINTWVRKRRWSS
jgi:ABC-2 type transport system permease protein